jgi:hypothetical protein
MKTIFKKDKNWKKLEKILGTNVLNKIVRKNIRTASRLNGKIYEKHLRNTIKSGKFEDNAQLTQLIKGDNKPLVGFEPGATLFKSVTSKVLGTNNPFLDFVFVGVLRTSENYNIALTVHYGKTISVTEKMRGLFLVLASASQGKLDSSKLTGRAKTLFGYFKKWKPLNNNTTKIIIPPREFVDEAFKDGGIKNVLIDNWFKAFKSAYKELVSMT